MASATTVANHNEAKGPQHVFVFDNLRTRSHLFWRWICTHEGMHCTYHPYLMAGILGPECILPELRETEARTKENAEMMKHFGVEETFESSNHALEKDIVEAEKLGKPLFTNEHCLDVVNHYIQLDLIRRGDQALPSFDYAFPNPTYLPDRLLNKFNPVILIRHPILQVHSLYLSLREHTQCRPGLENFDCTSTLHLSRLMFEYFRLSRGSPPIVIDGEDTVLRTEELGRNFCSAVGVDPNGLRDEWEALSATWWNHNDFVRAMTKTMHESTGIQRPKEKPAPPEKDRAFREWTEKYGYETARLMMQRVDLAMPHYEYLVQFKI